MGINGRKSSLCNNPYLYPDVPTKMATFAAETANDPLILGTNAACLGPAKHSRLGGTVVSDTTGSKDIIYLVRESYAMLI